MSCVGVLLFMCGLTTVSVFVVAVLVFDLTMAEG